MSIDDEIEQTVELRGMDVISIPDHFPSFFYTVGLMFTRNHPEMIIFGLPEEGSRILRAMFAQISNGKSFAEKGVFEGILTRGSIVTRPVHPTQHQLYLGFAMGYCTNHGRSGQLQAIQVFWPDKEGRFPFERGCDDAVWHAQPRLDQPVNPDELREFKKRIGTP